MSKEKLNYKRNPHAPQDLNTRFLKGVKIERLLNLKPMNSPIEMLEIGTGSGGIAHYFSLKTNLNCNVESVDVVDVRKIVDGFNFQLVEGTQLPFPEQSFDVVLSNHVIEHVGGKPDQYDHLKEFRRVLKHDGVGYLAVPNRWMLIEPHYRLLFLSWLPRRFRSPYLKLMRKGEYYDCEPLEMAELESMFEKTYFDSINLCVPALREVLKIENMNGVIASLLKQIPDSVLLKLLPLFPTLIYRVVKKGN